jgi:hypothetical protein
MEYYLVLNIVCYSKVIHCEKVFLTVKTTIPHQRRQVSLEDHHNEAEHEPLCCHRSESSTANYIHNFIASLRWKAEGSSVVIAAQRASQGCGFCIGNYRPMREKTCATFCLWEYTPLLFPTNSKSTSCTSTLRSHSRYYRFQPVFMICRHLCKLH